MDGFYAMDAKQEERERKAACLRVWCVCVCVFMCVHACESVRVGACRCAVPQLKQFITHRSLSSYIIFYVEYLSYGDRVWVGECMGGCMDGWVHG